MKTSWKVAISLLITFIFLFVVKLALGNFSAIWSVISPMNVEKFGVDPFLLPVAIVITFIIFTFFALVLIKVIIPFVLSRIFWNDKWSYKSAHHLGWLVKNKYGLFLVCLIASLLVIFVGLFTRVFNHDPNIFTIGKNTIYNDSASVREVTAIKESLYYGEKRPVPDHLEISDYLALQWLVAIILAGVLLFYLTSWALAEEIEEVREKHHIKKAHKEVRRKTEGKEAPSVQTQATQKEPKDIADTIFKESLSADMISMFLKKAIFFLFRWEKK